MLVVLFYNFGCKIPIDPNKVLNFRQPNMFLFALILNLLAFSSRLDEKIVLNATF